MLRDRAPAPWIGFFVLVWCLGLMILRDLPWHLDDKDQAKQAWIAVEMLREGGEAWWFQHTPDGEVATKPPLMGWINAGLRQLGFGWDWAWRLPGLLVSLWLLAALWRRGARDLGGWYGILAMAIFGLNLLTPRVAALVRTDALLAASVSWAGLAIYDGLRSPSPARAVPSRQSVSWQVAAALTVAALLKGPIAWVFLLPGALVYGIWRRLRAVDKEQMPPLPVAWWAWVLPLLPFGIWTWMAIEHQPGFYHHVVEVEFLGRFERGEDASHSAQKIYYYLLQLAKAFAPWVIGAIVLSVLDRGSWRRAFSSPQVRWLLLASLVGLVIMSAIPSKRLDRVFPVVPMLALAAVHWLAVLRHPRRLRISLITAAIAVVAYTGYAAAQAWQRQGQDEFQHIVRYQLEDLLAREGVELSAGGVASLEREYESLFLWQPEIALIESGQLRDLQAAGELEVVLVRAKERPKLTDRFPASRQLFVIPPPAEFDKPLEVWLVPPPSTD